MTWSHTANINGKATSLPNEHQATRIAHSRTRLNWMELLSLSLKEPLGPIHTNWKRKRKGKRSKNKQKKKSQNSLSFLLLLGVEWALKMEGKLFSVTFHGKLSMISSITSAFPVCGRMNSSSNTSTNISGTTTDLVRNTRRVRTWREATDADVVQDLKLAQMVYVPVRNSLP